MCCFHTLNYYTLIMSLCLSLRWALVSFGRISVINIGHALQIPPPLSHSHQFRKPGTLELA